MGFELMVLLALLVTFLCGMWLGYDLRRRREKPKQATQAVKAVKQPETGEEKKRRLADEKANRERYEPGFVD